MRAPATGITDPSYNKQREDFEAAIVQQRKATEALVARVNEQEAQIQKVSAKTEVGNSGSQMLVKNQ